MKRKELKEWIKTTALDLIEKGYVVVPAAWEKDDEGNKTVSATGKNTLKPLVKFKDIEEPLPLDSSQWNDAEFVGIRLGDLLLIDYDGNKGGDDTITISDLEKKVGVDLAPAFVQSNETGDSLHYLFKWKKGFDVSKYKQSNDGRWIKYVDVKTHNQMLYLKPGKTMNFPNVSELPPVPKALKKVLRDGKPKKASGKGFRTSAADIREIKKCLSFIDPNCDGATWRNILFALSYNFNYSEIGYKIALDFSMGDYWKGVKGWKLYAFDEMKTNEVYFRGSKSEPETPKKIETLFAICNDVRSGNVQLLPDSSVPKKALKYFGKKKKKKVVDIEPDIEEPGGIQTLEIPDHVLNVGGLIGLGIDALKTEGKAVIPQYYYPAVLAIVANVAAFRYSFSGQHPNLYNIKVGPTGTAKSEVDEFFRQAIDKAGITNFYGATSFASGPGLLRHISSKKIMLLSIDEATYMFKRNGDADAHASSKREALLEVYTKSGGVMEKVYSDIKNNIRIECPVVSIIGNATPTIFDDIELADFETGLLQRFDFWYNENEPKRSSEVFNSKNKAIHKFTKAIKKELSDVTNKNIQNLLPDEKATNLINDLSKDVNESIKGIDDETKRGILSRRYNLAKKYAVVHYMNRLGEGRLTVKDIQFGIDVATLLSNWKLDHLYNAVSVGDFADKREYLFNGVKRITERGMKATYAVICNRCRKVKNWNEREYNEIVNVLEKEGKLYRDDSGSVEYLRLSKKG